MEFRKNTFSYTRLISRIQHTGVVPFIQAASDGAQNTLIGLLHPSHVKCIADLFVGLCDPKCMNKGSLYYQELTSEFNMLLSTFTYNKQEQKSLHWIAILMLFGTLYKRKIVSRREIEYKLSSLTKQKLHISKRILLHYLDDKDFKDYAEPETTEFTKLKTLLTFEEITGKAESIVNNIGAPTLCYLFQLKSEPLLRVWLLRNHSKLNDLYPTLYQDSVFMYHPILVRILRELGACETVPIQRYHLFMEANSASSYGLMDSTSETCDVEIQFPNMHPIKVHSIVLYARCKPFIDLLYKQTLDSNLSPQQQQEAIEAFWTNLHFRNPQKRQLITAQLPYQVSKDALIALFSYFYSENQFIPDQLYTELAQLWNNLNKSWTPFIFKQHKSKTNTSDWKNSMIREAKAWKTFIVYSEELQEDEYLTEEEVVEYTDIFLDNWTMISPKQWDVRYLELDYRNAINNPVGCDVVFVFPNTPQNFQSQWQARYPPPTILLGHKALLSFCEYFRGMFFGGLKESQTAFVPVEELSVITYMHLLEFVYTGTVFHFTTQWENYTKFDTSVHPEKLQSLSQLSLDCLLRNLFLYEDASLFSKKTVYDMLLSNEDVQMTQYWLTGDLNLDLLVQTAFDLIPVAHEFMLPGLTNLCELFLCNNYTVSLDNIFDALAMARTFELEKLTSKFLISIADKIAVINIEKPEEWQSLPPTEKNAVMAFVKTRTPYQIELDNAEAKKLQQALDKIEEKKKRQEEAKKAALKKQQTVDNQPQDFGEVLVFVDNKKTQQGKKKKKK